MSTAEGSPRERLLDAADALFYKHGVGNTGIDAVLEHAQVARNTLYHHFGGKAGLVEEYLRRRGQRWTSHWLRTIERSDEPVERLLAVFEALATWYPAGRSVRGCAFMDALVEVADPDHPATHVVYADWVETRGRLVDLARDAALREPVRIAEDVLLLYRGALAAMMFEPADLAIDRARRLARLAIDRRP